MEYSIVQIIFGIIGGIMLLAGFGSLILLMIWLYKEIKKIN
jgi:hypothetical protein